MPLDLTPAGKEPLRARDDPGLVRVRRGWYTDRAAFEAAPSHERYPIEVRAAAAARPGAVFARESALALAGLPFGRPSDVFTIDDPNIPGRLAGIRNSHARVAAEDVIVVDGIARCVRACARRSSRHAGGRGQRARLGAADRSSDA